MSSEHFNARLAHGKIPVAGVVAAIRGGDPMAVLIRLAVVVASCGLLLFTAPARAQARSQATSHADPAAWGLYTHLADTTRRAPDGYGIRWHWSQPGRELVEEYFVPRTGKLQSTGIITMGAHPGTLHLKSSALGGKEWNGAVQPDGSVVYVGTGLLKLHFKAVLASDGAYEVRPLKLRHGAVVSVGEPGSSNRYLPAGAPAKEAVAVAPSGAMPSSNPATEPVSATQAAALGAGVPAAVAMPVGTPASQPSLDWLNALVGRSFVGTSPSGGPFNLTVSREGDVVVLTQGGERLALRQGAAPGRFELLSVWHGGSINDNAVAYVAGSAGAPTSDPLDGYSGDSRKPGDLVANYNVSGGYITLVFHPTPDGGFTYSQDGGRRIFGMRRAVGDASYSDLRWFVPATQQATEHALAYSAARQHEQEEQRREDEALDAYAEAERQQRAAAWGQTQAASEQALADSVARLNDTVASVQAQQAQYKLQQQAAEVAAANARRQGEIDNARAATQRQEDQAAHYAAQRRLAEQQRAAAAEQPRTAALAITNTDRTSTTAPAIGKAAPGRVLGFCSGITLGGFERDNQAVIYVSSIGPMDYTFGQPMEPLKEAYAAKVGVAGLIPDCMVSADRAMLERKRQEAIDNRGYPNAKRIMTEL